MNDAEFDKLLANAKARFAALSPEEQAAENEAQRQSWVRGEMGMGETATLIKPAMTPTPATAERLARALHRLMAPERRRTSSGAWVIVESKQVEAEIEADAALAAYTAEGGKL